MKADLHLYSEGIPRLLIFSKCEYTYLNDTAQIVFKDDRRGTTVTIGLNRDKISMLRVRPIKGDEADKQFNVLGLFPEENKEMVEFDNTEMLFMANEAEIEYNARIAKVYLKCFVSVYNAKPILTGVRLICVAREDD